jgi:Co/Zn/Cd efflux system component
MKDPTSTKPRWPFGYRILLWLVGSILAIVLIMASIFVLNAPR